MRAFSISLSNSALPKKPQLFETGGCVLVLTKRTIAKNGSIAAKLTLMALAPCALASLAPMRQLVNRVFHSTTSKSTSKKHSFRFCCTYSFIGSGCIWPEPDADTCTFTLSGLAAE
ncbi:hypothetical protein D3C81_1170080 [compost metagenome]